MQRIIRNYSLSGSTWHLDCQLFSVKNPGCMGLILEKTISTSTAHCCRPNTRPRPSTGSGWGYCSYDGVVLSWPTAWASHP